jgi:hypothetical protein
MASLRNRLLALKRTAQTVARNGDGHAHADHLAAATGRLAAETAACPQQERQAAPTGPGVAG